jgi:hypothetical protein
VNGPQLLKTAMGSRLRFGAPDLSAEKIHGWLQWAIRPLTPIHPTPRRDDTYRGAV